MDLYLGHFQTSVVEHFIKIVCGSWGHSFSSENFAYLLNDLFHQRSEKNDCKKSYGEVSTHVSSIPSIYLLLQSQQ